MGLVLVEPRTQLGRRLRRADIPRVAVEQAKLALQVRRQVAITGQLDETGEHLGVAARRQLFGRGRVAVESGGDL